MRRKNRIISLVLGVLVIALFAKYSSSCSRATDSLDDESSMQKVLGELVPVGTPLSDAERIMVAEGFTCQQFQNTEFLGAEKVDYLYCHRDDGGGPVFRVWKIAVVHEQELVTEVRVNTGLVGP